MFLGGQQQCWCSPLKCPRWVGRNMAESRRKACEWVISTWSPIRSRLCRGDRSKGDCICMRYLHSPYVHGTSSRESTSACFQKFSFLSPQFLSRFPVLLPERSSLGSMSLGERNGGLHSCLNWDPVSGLSLLYKREGLPRTRTCTGSGKEE